MMGPSVPEIIDYTLSSNNIPNTVSENNQKTMKDQGVF